MPQVETRKDFDNRLPSRLTEALNRIAQKYGTKGVKLFIFGSFARAKHRKTSDLDIGVLWVKKRNPRIFTELYHDIRELPTVRKIDLVDMELVDKKFKQKAVEEGIMLTNESSENEPKQ